MTAEVLKYTREQVEALELAPGTEHKNLEGWVPVLLWTGWSMDIETARTAAAVAKDAAQTLGPKNQDEPRAASGGCFGASTAAKPVAALRKFATDCRRMLTSA